MFGNGQFRHVSELKRNLNPFFKQKLKPIFFLLNRLPVPPPLHSSKAAWIDSALSGASTEAPCVLGSQTCEEEAVDAVVDSNKTQAARSGAISNRIKENLVIRMPRNRAGHCMQLSGRNHSATPNPEGGDPPVTRAQNHQKQLSTVRVESLVCLL